ncbi:MAG: nucleoside monophosphate kinase [bacterium]
MMGFKLAIFFLGPPGAGKDTQAGLLAKKLNLALLSSGDIVREKIKNNPKMKKIYDSGKLTPPETMAQWTIEAINQKKSFIFSGALRTLQEAKKLLFFLEKNNYQIFAFNIDISPQETLKRNLLRARDIIDTEDKIKERLNVYDKQTKPVLDFFEDKIIQINGEQSIKQVHKDISDAFGRQDFSSNNGASCASCQTGCVFAGTK